MWEGNRLNNYGDWSNEVASWQDRKDTEMSLKDINYNQNMTSRDRGFGLHTKPESDKSVNKGDAKVLRNDNDYNSDIDTHSCHKTVCRAFDVSVPVTTTPFAVPMKHKVKCTGKSMITPGHQCCESKNNRIKFTITQRINVDIPINFGADVCYGETCSVDKGLCGKHEC